MKAKVENPFILAGYEGPEYFCDRVEETDRLIGALRNGRNVTLLSPRRVGKTGLIRHAFGELAGLRDWRTVYVDMFAAQNLQEFTRRFAAAVIGSMDTVAEKALAVATRFFKGIRPTIAVDPVTGTPSYSFSLQSADVESTLDQCFDYLAGRKGRTVVAIDEFQQVAGFPEKGTEALLRSRIQFLTHTRFVFAGSRRHLMAEMFSSPKRPFYQSTQMFPLEPIPEPAYFAFAAKHMRSRKLRLEEKLFSEIYRTFDGVTWYVHAVLNRMYAYGDATRAGFVRAIDSLVAENAYNFGNLIESYPPGCVRLMKAVAREGAVREVNAGDFIGKYGLRASSSVNLSLKKLLDNEIVYRADNGYVIDDRIFGLWLRRMA